MGGAQFETDRARFLGRGRGIRTPISVIDGRPLSNTVGAVLDPIFSLRRRFRLAPGATARIAFWTLVAPRAAKRSTWPTSITTQRRSSAPSPWPGPRRRCSCIHLGIGPDEAHLFQRLANHVLYCESRAAAFVRCACTQRERTVDAVGTRYLRRPADRVWSGSMRPKSWKSFASYSAPTSTGG